MEFFKNEKVGSYLGRLYEKLKEEVTAFKNDDILTCDFNEWADYLSSKYCLDIITLYEENIEKKMTETKVKINNQFRGLSGYQPEFFMIDGYCISYTIPFDGNADLLFLRPSTCILSSFEVTAVQRPTKDSCGNFSLEFSYAAQELKGQLDVTNYVNQQFNHEFGSYRQMIGNINTEVERFNKKIRPDTIALLEARRKRATDYSDICQSLNIPMKLSSSAPNIAPLPLKKIERTPVAKPTAKPSPKEYCISDEDYKNIINIIHNCCSSMEATARTFTKPGEEELRDFILATLGTHYVDMATGETFRKVGKTDINIVFENKSAFIGECKIWHGIKKFEDAIEQLNSYSTWKDTKTALIVFNKEIKDFSSIQQSVLSWIKSNTKQYEIINCNICRCVLHRSDTNTDIQIAIAIYDLTI